MFLQHIGKESGAGRLVLRIEIPRPRQTMVKLRRRADRIPQDLRGSLCGGGQIVLRAGDLRVATLEKLHPGHQRRDERREQNQEQEPELDAQRSTFKEEGGCASFAAVAPPVTSCVAWKFYPKAIRSVCKESSTHRRSGGQGRNRTTDTRIFSPLLYQLSYLAAGTRPEFRARFSGGELYQAGGFSRL